MIGAIILAAGNGSRYGGYKQFEKVNGKQIIDYTIDIFKNIVDNMIIVMPEHYSSGLYRYTVGGKTRFESICNGFEFVKNCEKILIVDAVRPNTRRKLVKNILDELDDYDCVIPTLSPTETVVLMTGTEFKPDGLAGFIPDRETVRFCQTPIGYQNHILQDAMKIAKVYNKVSSNIMAYHIADHSRGSVKIIKGDPDNIKITYPHDLKLFEFLVKENRNV